MSALLALVRNAARTPRPSVLAGALAFVLLWGSPGCLARPGEKTMPAPARPLTEVLAAHTPELMAIPGVVGTAESRTKDGRPCILVLLARPTPESRARLPRQLEGWPVRVETTGELHALPDSSR